MKTLDLIVPCYNEEEALPIFYNTVVPIVDGLADSAVRFLFVDDGSRDKTRAVLRDLAEKDEDVLSYALFPQVAKKFFEQRKANRGEKTVVIPDTQHDASDAADNSVRTIYVEDMTEGMTL